MSHSRSHRKYHSEAVEHRNLYHHTVAGRKIHTVADKLTVVYDIIVCKHYTLGESRRTRGVLHICNVVNVDRRGTSAHFFGSDLRRKLKRCFPSESTLHFEADGNNISEEGKSAAVERTSGSAVLKLGAELFHNFLVVSVTPAVSYDKSVRVRLTEEVFCLVYLVCRIYRNENCADLNACPERDKPLGNVRRPNSDLITLLYAESDKSTCKRVNVISELRVSAGIIKSCVLESILVGEKLDHFVKHL